MFKFKWEIQYIYMVFEYRMRLFVLIQICLGEETRISFFY